MDSLTSFIRLFALGDAAAAERLHTRLALVLADPAAYETEYAEELLERDIEAGLPRQELRDVALIDALVNDDLAWESSMREHTASIADGLNEVLWRQQRPRLDAEALGTRTGPDALDAVQEALEPLGLALVLCTLDSDSYPLSVVADADAETARKLAAELGFTVAVY